MTKRTKGSADLWAAGTLAILASSLVLAQGYEPAVNQGRTLTPAAAQQIEASLIASLHDLHARARLLGYYSLRAGQDPASRLARLRQVEWLIENEPATLLLRNPAARLQPSDFADPYSSYRESLRTAWKKQADQRPDDALVIENAWESLGGVEFGFFNGASASSADYLGGRTPAEYLKRLRVLEPGDPEWALDLAGIYGFALTRASAPGARDDTKQLATIIQAELEKSDDVAVIGLAGASLYFARAQSTSLSCVIGTCVDEFLLRRAAALNPKNPAWARVLNAPVPNDSAGFGAALTATLQETDLWPRGIVPTMTVPAAAVRLSEQAMVKDMVSRPTPIEAVIPPKAIGTGCTVRFDALIGSDGRIKNLQVVAFDHLNIPFVAAERDGIRQVQYKPMLVDGQPVEVVTQIDRACAKAIQTPKQVKVIK